MEKIADIPFVEGFVRMCSDGWKQGWHERNGGNFSYRMKETEVEQVKDFYAILMNGKKLELQFRILRENISWLQEVGNIFAMQNYVQKKTYVFWKLMKQEKSIEFVGGLHRVGVRQVNCQAI